MSTARTRRDRQNVYTLVGALLASLALVVVVVAVTVRPDSTDSRAVDWHTIHAQAPGAATLVDPTFTDADGSWWSNRTDYSEGTIPEWYIGFVTPSGSFATIRQFGSAISSSVTDELNDGTASTTSIAGTTAQFIDRSAVENPGNDVRILVLGLPGGGSLIVSGTAPLAELKVLAERSVESLKG